MNQTGVESTEGKGLKIRGLLYGAVYGWMLERYGGPERFGEFKKHLPIDIQRRLSGFEEAGWLPSELKDWYPAREVYFLYERLIDFMKSEMTQKEVIEGLVGYMFERSITGFMKGLMSFLTPATLIRRSSTFWRRVHSSGEVTIMEQDKTRLVITLSGWKAHKISCAIFEGWTKQLLKLTGKTVTSMTKTRCVLDGDPVCEWGIEFS